MNFDLQKLMEQLLELRRQLISGHMTCHQKDELKLKMVDKINLGTRLLDLDIVAREPDGLAVDTKRSSAVHIFNRVNIYIEFITDSFTNSVTTNLRFFSMKMHAVILNILKMINMLSFLSKSRTNFFLL
jgi:hypothetical protein